MSESFSNFLIAITIIALVGIVIGGIAYMNNNASERYYNAYHECIENGGMWIPMHGESYSALCVRGMVTQK